MSVGPELFFEGGHSGGEGGYVDASLSSLSTKRKDPVWSRQPMCRFATVLQDDGLPGQFTVDGFAGTSLERLCCDCRGLAATCLASVISLAAVRDHGWL